MDAPQKHDAHEGSRPKTHMNMKCPELANPQRQGANWWLPGAGEEREGVMDHGDRLSSGVEGNVLELDRGDSS